jgi:hypothetical protein
MTVADHHGISFYLFDFDDNIMFLQTPIFLLNTLTRVVQSVGTGEFATIQPALGRPGKWGDYAIFDGTYSNFRDIPEPASGQQEYFVRDIISAIDAHASAWKGPSWDMFVHACDKQRPLSIVTARGHSAATLRAGVKVLADRGLIPREPNYHTVFPVGNPDVRRQLGDSDLMMTTPALKKVAIVKSVDRAIVDFASEADLHFGMSDDDPQNVQLIIAAMRQCKTKYPDRRFFVIDTHPNEKVKLEVFPMNFAVTRVEQVG